MSGAAIQARLHSTKAADLCLRKSAWSRSFREVDRMDIFKKFYKKLASLILCIFSVIGLATGVRNLTGKEGKRLGIIGGADGPTAVVISDDDNPVKTFLKFVATWSTIIAAISTLLLALIKKYVED